LQNNPFSQAVFFTSWKQKQHSLKGEEALLLGPLVMMGHGGLSLVICLIPAVSTAWNDMLVLNQHLRNPTDFL